MRLLTLFAVSAFLMLSCDKDEKDCGTHNGNQLYKGPEGGCYYMNSSGNKTYVDASECDC